MNDLNTQIKMEAEALCSLIRKMQLDVVFDARAEKVGADFIRVYPALTSIRERLEQLLKDDKIPQR